MAVSDADWRKSNDGYRTGTADGARCIRSETDGFSAAADLRAYGAEHAAKRTLADNTDEGEDRDVPNAVETDDHAVSDPLAIEVLTERTIVAEWPDDGHADCVADGALRTGRSPNHDVDGGEIYLHYFIPGPETRRQTVIVE